MAIDHVDRATVTEEHTPPAGQGPTRSIGPRIRRVGRGASELVRAVVDLAFGLIQSVIGAGVVALRFVASTVRVLVSRVVGVLRREPA